jgi:2-phosphosulfolactate phosphatase
MFFNNNSLEWWCRMFDQSPYKCRVEWGGRDAREAALRGDITIIVDVLSFSSTVTTALNFGASIFPFPPPMNETAIDYAKSIGAQLVWGRAEAAKFGGHSLSPTSFTPADDGQKFVICSLNGAACTWVASKVPALLIGCFLNASAVSNAANQLNMKIGANISVIACGEKWSSNLENENNMRPGIEDYLGAGFILSMLGGSKSPEAQVCIGAYEHSKAKIQELVWDCGSGRELRDAVMNKMLYTVPEWISAKLSLF